MKPIIGIIARISEENGKPIIMCMDNYRNAVIKAGGIPIIITPPQTINYSKDVVNKMTKEEKDIVKRQIDLVQGVIMPGGSRAYEFDKYICELCQDKPLFGICMGMQIMCNYDNDNSNLKVEEHYSPNDYVHTVKINKDSYLYSIIKEEEITVNSLHNYCVSNSGSYDICGNSDDIIEAVEKGKSFNIGVQWHPEKNYDTDIISQRLFEKFISKAKKAI